MLKSKLVRGFAALSALCLTSSALSVQAIAAPKPTSLLSTKCVKSGDGYYGDEIKDVVVAKEVLTAIFYMDNGDGGRTASVTCKIRGTASSPKYKTLNLAFGIPDTSNSIPAIVTVYLNGSPFISRTVASGEKEYLTIDVSKATNVTLEATGDQSSGRMSVRFFQTLLK